MIGSTGCIKRKIVQLFIYFCVSYSDHNHFVLYIMANRSNKRPREEETEAISKLLKDTQELMNNQTRTESTLLISQNLITQMLTEVKHNNVQVSSL